MTLPPFGDGRRRTEFPFTMHRLTPLAALCAGASLLSTPLHAQTHAVDAVTITATRVEQRVQDTLADVSIIDREQIEAAGQSTLTELLARQPGVQMTSNGGPGASVDYFIRGSDSRQTVVLIDGVRVGSGSSGTASLQYLPLSQIERIEVLRGPASAVFGADAIGGVIQIFTRRGDDGLQGEVFAGGGSYDTSEGSASLRGGDGRWRFALGAGVTSSRGFSSTNTRINEGVSVARRAHHPDRDGYLNQNFSGSVSFTPHAGTEIGVSTLASKGYNEFDSGLSFPKTRNDFDNDSITLHLTHAWNDVLSTTLRTGRSVEDFISYARTSPLGNHFRTEQHSHALEARLKLPLGTLFGSVERLEQDVLSTTPTTVNIDTERKIDSLQLGWSGAIDRHSLQLNTRHDRYSTGSQHKTTGNVAYGYRLTEEWRLHGGYGTAFRLPTFNQLFFPGFGNPDLAPESSRNRDAGVVWQRKGSRAALTAYDNRVSNLINTVTVSPGVSEARNVGEARLRGVTLDGSTYLFGHTEVQGSVDLLDATDQDTGDRLQRRAVQTGQLRIVQHMTRGRVGVEVQTSGDRYSNAGELRRLGGYTLLNLYGVWKLSPEVALEGRINNLTDKDYTTVFGYNMAGSSVFVGVRYTPQF